MMPLVRVWVLTTLLLSIGTVCVSAQSDLTNQNATIQQLQQRIDELEASQKTLSAELDKMKGKDASAVPEPTPQPEPMPEPAAEQPRAHVLGPVELHGFGDVDYGRAWFEKLPPTGLPGSPNSFNVGDFDLFTNTRLSDRWSVLGEMLVTSDFSNEFGVEMDRFLLSYKQNDYFKISVGKFATGLGYYTTEFHRAQYFQTAVGRPIMYADEDNGGLLPTHGIGLSATGLIPSGGVGLHWIAELANGRSSTHPDVPIQNFVDENNGKAVNFGLYAKPERLNGFRTGVSVYHDTLHPPDLPQTDETIIAVHAVYTGSKLEFLNEGAIVRLSLKDQNTVFHEPTAYSQIAWAFGKTRPYFRYDYQNVAASDPIFGSLGRRNGPSIGVSRHLSNYVVLKAQYGRLAQGLASSTNTLQSQLAFAF
jgi:hypothetical protein